MATITGQATDPNSPGVLGLPMNANIPGTEAIGVKGDGGTGFPSPIPLPGVPGRIGIGVYGTTADPNGAGICGDNTAGGYAGNFQKGIIVFGNIEAMADVHVSGTLTAKQDVVLGSDCAEDFDIGAGAEVEPGTVMVLDGNGALHPSDQKYDKKVAGVISGAGDYRPGMILGRCASTQKRMPLALVGKVYCKVDAHYGPVEVGDLLTTSPTPGHAMRAVDPLKAFGAVIGKALRPLESGQGLVPILVALQ